MHFAHQPRAKTGQARYVPSKPSKKSCSVDRLPPLYYHNSIALRPSFRCRLHNIAWDLCASRELVPIAANCKLLPHTTQSSPTPTHSNTIAVQSLPTFTVEQIHQHRTTLYYLLPLRLPTYGYLFWKDGVECGFPRNYQPRRLHQPRSQRPSSQRCALWTRRVHQFSPGKWTLSPVGGKTQACLFDGKVQARKETHCQLHRFRN